MMLPWDTLVGKYDLARRVKGGVLHVGGHLGEEAPFYAQLGLPVWWTGSQWVNAAGVTS